MSDTAIADTAIMERLRTETRDLHTKAEQHPFQKSMLKCELGRAGYVSWLSQMYLVHLTLDRAIEAKMADCPELQVIEARQLQIDYLLEDLSVFGVDPSTIEAMPATTQLTDDINATAERDAVELLGLFYVLDGANNGNRFIVHKLRPSIGIEPGQGDKYLLPYGEEQPAVWAAFKERMGGIGLNADQCDRIVKSAERMFEGVIEISDDLWPTVTVVAGADAPSHA